MRRSGAVLILTCVVGTIGYRLIGGAEYSLIECLYMTVVTLTTVGYREVIDLSSSPSGQIFTVLLLMLGVGSFLYFFSNMMAFMIEGTLERMFWKRRMTRRIARMRDHYIVCGGGRTGSYVIDELISTDRPFVLIEQDSDRVEELFERFGNEFGVVIGDATSDPSLREAGIEHARGIVSCISSDKDNLIVAFSARDLKPDIRIVTRCTEEREQTKLRKAGSDAVVTPDQIGALRLVSELVRPTVVTFLDQMLRDDSALRIEEVRIAPGSALESSTLRQLKQRGIGDLMVVAVRMLDGEWLYNPPDSTELVAEMGVVFIGSPKARTEVEHAATA